MSEDRLCIECGGELRSNRKKKFCNFACAFWHYFDKSGGPEACWLWRGHCNRDGYGNTPEWMCDGRRTAAHRRAWRLTFGDPGRLHVLHRCDNPKCGNPRHLWLGTHIDNIRDAWAKGRPMAAAPGSAHPHAKLTEGQVSEIRASRARDAALAELYGVSCRTIRAVRAGATWRHVRAVLPEDAVF